MYAPKKTNSERGCKEHHIMYTWFLCFFYNLKATTIKTFIMVQELEFSVGDYLLSKRFGWQYKIISIRYGVAVIQDIVRENVRMKFSLSALRNRVKNDSFVHSPLPF